MIRLLVPASKHGRWDCKDTVGSLKHISMTPSKSLRYLRTSPTSGVSLTVLVKGFAIILAEAAKLQQWEIHTCRHIYIYCIYIDTCFISVCKYIHTYIYIHVFIYLCICFTNEFSIPLFWLSWPWKHKGIMCSGLGWWCCSVVAEYVTCNLLGFI